MGETGAGPGTRRVRRYAVVGVGAIGGYYGARLAESGVEVHWLARSDADHLRSKGLHVSFGLASSGPVPAGPAPSGPVSAGADFPGHGDLHLTGLSVHSSADTVPPVDCVLLATKTTATQDVLPAVAAIVASSRAAGIRPSVVCMQNGYGVEESVAAGLPPDVPVVGGMCFICAVKEGPGRVRHLDYGAVTLAGADGVRAVAEDLGAAGVPVEVAPDLLASRWRKLVWNVPFNGLSVVLDAGTDAIMADPDARALAEDLMREVVAASLATGHPVAEDVVEAMLAATAAMSPYDTSMRVDFAARRPLEVEAIYGAPVAAAAAAGVAMPRTEALGHQLAFLDRRNRRQQSA